MDQRSTKNHPVWKWRK